MLPYLLWLTGTGIYFSLSWCLLLLPDLSPCLVFCLWADKRSLADRPKRCTTSVKTKAKKQTTKQPNKQQQQQPTNAKQEKNCWAFLHPTLGPSCRHVGPCAPRQPGERSTVPGQGWSSVIGHQASGISHGGIFGTPFASHPPTTSDCRRRTQR